MWSRGRQQRKFKEYTCVDQEKGPSSYGVYRGGAKENEQKKDMKLLL